VLPAASAEQAISLARDTAGRFYRTRLRPGYQIAEVDKLIARIEATLTTGTRPVQAVTAADVQAAKFGTTRLGGYDEPVVDEALDYYAGALARLALSPDSTTGPDTDSTDMTR
jgi:DivIVA domain-containing protein